MARTEFSISYRLRELDNLVGQLKTMREKVAEAARHQKEPAKTELDALWTALYDHLGMLERIGDQMADEADRIINAALDGGPG